MISHEVKWHVPHAELIDKDSMTLWEQQLARLPSKTPLTEVSSTSLYTESRIYCGLNAIIHEGAKDNRYFL